MAKFIQIDKHRKLGRFQKLPERLQEAYWLVVDALCEMKPKVTIPIHASSEFLDLYSAIRYDYPELKLIWDYEKSKYSEHKIGSKLVSVEWFLTYKGSKEYLSQLIRKIDIEVEKIINESVCGKRMSDEQCIEAIYKAIAAKMVYSKSIDNNETKYPAHSYTLECILHGNGVCAGMASLFAYTLNKLQIPVMVINGMACGGSDRDRHAWNIVKMSDGSFKHIDVTWDAGGKKTTYLALDDLAMQSKRHEWVICDYPVCM